MDWWKVMDYPKTIFTYSYDELSVELSYDEEGIKYHRYWLNMNKTIIVI